VKRKKTARVVHLKLKKRTKPHDSDEESSSSSENSDDNDSDSSDGVSDSSSGSASGGSDIVESSGSDGSSGKPGSSSNRVKLDKPQFDGTSVIHSSYKIGTTIGIAYRLQNLLHSTWLCMLMLCCCLTSLMMLVVVTSRPSLEESIQNR